jgi:hypothetical protein
LVERRDERSLNAAHAKWRRSTVVILGSGRS